MPLFEYQANHLVFKIQFMLSLMLKRFTLLEDLETDHTLVTLQAPSIIMAKESLMKDKIMYTSMK